MLRTSFFLAATLIVSSVASVSPASAQPKPVQIITEKAEIHWIDVAPDGSRLVYSARSPKKEEHDLKVWTIAERPYKFKTIAKGVAGEFSSDGQRIVFYSEARLEKPYWVTLIEPTGKEEKGFEAQGIDPTAARASWSPTGRTILYTNRSGAYLLDIATGESRQITTKVLTAPTWHPSAPELIFEKKGGGLARLDVIEGEIEDLSSRGHVPRYSPDGKQLLYMHDFKIHIMDLETKKSRMITEGISARWTNAGLGIVALKESGTMTKGESFDIADLSATWVSLVDGAQVPLMGKAHGVSMRSNGRDLYFGVHRDGVYHVKLPALAGESELRKKLGVSDPEEEEEEGGALEDEPVKKFDPPKGRATDKPIDSKVLKAIQ